MTNSSLSSTRVTRIVNGVNKWVIYQTHDTKKSKLILLSFFKAPQVCFANQISGKFCVILFGFLPLTSVFRLVHTLPFHLACQILTSHLSRLYHVHHVQPHISWKAKTWRLRRHFTNPFSNPFTNHFILFSSPCSVNHILYLFFFSKIISIFFFQIMKENNFKELIR